MLVIQCAKNSRSGIFLFDEKTLFSQERNGVRRVDAATFIKERGLG